MARRRLTDLYKVGKMVTLNDDTGEDPVEVYIRKITPLEQDNCLKRANAARSTTLALRNKPDSDEYQNQLVDVQEMDLDSKINALIAEPLAKIRMAREAELAGADESEWAKDDYLDGLQESWNNGMQQAYQDDPEDPDAKRVFLELKRFTDEVDKIMEGEQEALKRDWASLPIDEIDRRMVNKMLEVDADGAWLREFRACELFHAVRDPEDPKHKYFESKDEIEELDLKVRIQLYGEYQSLTVDTAEGKDSPSPELSSDSSGPPESQETGEASGQLAATL